LIERRTVVLFIVALAVSIPVGVNAYREYSMLHACDRGLKSAIQSDARLVVYHDAQVSFPPCGIDGEVTTWWRVTVLSWFFLWVAFFCSLVQDVFVYVRERRRGTIVGGFRLLR
jgi:hypothetical protein